MLRRNCQLNTATNMTLLRLSLVSHLVGGSNACSVGIVSNQIPWEPRLKACLVPIPTQPLEWPCCIQIEFDYKIGGGFITLLMVPDRSDLFLIRAPSSITHGCPTWLIRGAGWRRTVTYFKLNKVCFLPNLLYITMLEESISSVADSRWHVLSIMTLKWRELYEKVGGPMKELIEFQDNVSALIRESALGISGMELPFALFMRRNRTSSHSNAARMYWRIRCVTIKQTRIRVAIVACLLGVETFSIVNRTWSEFSDGVN